MKVQGQAQSHPDAMRQGTWGSVCSVCSGLRTGLNERHCKIQRNKMQQTNSTKPRYQLDAKRSNEEKSQDATSNTATHETQQDEMICNKPTVHGDIGHNHGPINMHTKPRQSHGPAAAAAAAAAGERVGALACGWLAGSGSLPRLLLQQQACWRCGTRDAIETLAAPGRARSARGQHARRNAV